jgi:hypothetical protein
MAVRPFIPNDDDRAPHPERKAVNVRGRPGAGNKHRPRDGHGLNRGADFSLRGASAPHGVRLKLRAAGKPPHFRLANFSPIGGPEDHAVPFWLWHRFGVFSEHCAAYVPGLTSLFLAWELSEEGVRLGGRKRPQKGRVG